MWTQRLVAASVGALMWAIGVSAVAPTASSAAEPVLRPPSDAPVIDGFRLPDGPYGAGNRGLEYGTGVDDSVRAAADGTVSFAGAVAGELFVTVEHGGGMRTTVGFVGRVLVRRGDTVRAGRLLATTDGPFHFTLRHGDVYVDPTAWFGVRRVRVRLVPHARAQGDVRAEPTTEAPALRSWSHRAFGFAPVGSVAHAATLPDGPSGPRTTPQGWRRSQVILGSPGRHGAFFEDVQPGKRTHGSHLHEAAAGGRRPLRPPDPPVEPEDEAVHPR